MFYYYFIIYYNVIPRPVFSSIHRIIYCFVVYRLVVDKFGPILAFPIILYILLRVWPERAFNVVPTIADATGDLSIACKSRMSTFYKNRFSIPLDTTILYCRRTIVHLLY